MGGWVIGGRGVWVGRCLGRGEGVGVCLGGGGCGWDVGEWRLSCFVKETSQREEGIQFARSEGIHFARSHKYI